MNYQFTFNFMSLEFFFHPFADDLVVELDTNAAVFVPSCLIQTIEIELAHALQLLVNACRHTKIDNMITHER